MNSLSDYLLHYTELAVATQTTVMILLEALLTQQEKSLHRNRISYIYHEGYLSNISVTQGFHCPQIQIQKSDNRTRHSHNSYANSKKQAHQPQCQVV